MTESVIDVLNKIDDERKAEVRKLTLIKYVKHTAVRRYLNCIFNEELMFADFTNLKYKALGVPMGYGETNLVMVSSKLYLFTEDFNIPLKKKRLLLLGTLESLQKDEAEFLLSVLSKQYTFKNLKKAFVLNLIPDLFNTKLKK